MFLVDLSRRKAYNVDNFSCIYYVKNRLYIGTEHNEATVAEYDSENDCAKACYTDEQKGNKISFCANTD